MAESSVKKRTVSGLLWKFMERTGAQGVNFIVSMILARLLAPEMYGIIALVTVFTAILQIFVDSGMGNALIQKKDADDVDFSSVFYFNMAMCTILYLGMFIAAPYIAKFYNQPELVAVIRVMSFTLIISGLKNVQQAYVSKNMLFKKFFFSTLVGTTMSAIVGISMAYAGFGVWALVAQDLTSKTVDTTVLWFTVKWRPKLLFSFNRLKSLVSYGWKLLVSGLIDAVYNNIRQLIIGKMYSSTDLGLYNKGKQFPYVIVTNINTSIDSVLFPAMSSCQDDPSRVKTMTRRAIKTSSFIMWPLMMVLAFTAPSLIELILTEKWSGCVPFLQVFCVTYAFYPIHTANLNAVKAMGRSDLFLKLEVIKKVIGIVTLLVTMWFGVMAMAYSLLFTSVISQIVNSWPNRKLLNYNYIEQLKDILPAIILAILSCIFTKPIEMLNIPVILILLTQMILTMIIYMALSKIFKLDAFEYIIDMIKKMKRRNKA